MKILVTGGAGFIASHIVDRYVALGHEVLVVDNLSSGKREQLNPAARLIEADIRAPQVPELILKERPEIINHHAAQISVKVSTEQPVLDADINVIGMLNLLKAAASAGVRKFIFASSGGTIYGAPELLPTPETAPLQPLSPYGISKAAGELYLRFFAADRGLTYTSLRYSNVYGPRQDPHGEAGVVAIFSRMLLRGETPTIHWDGDQEKDMVYVADIAQANELALAGGDNRAYNIGTGTGSTVNQMFNRLQELAGTSVKPHHGPRRPGDLRRSVLDASLARAELGWQSSVDLATGLQHTLDYFRQEPARAPAAARPAQA